MKEMTSTEVARLILQIAETPGKKDKVALLAAHKDDPTLRMVLTKALDPFITYGIRKVPVRLTTEASGYGFTSSVWDMLFKLSTRQLSGNKALAAVEAVINALDAPSATLLTNIIRGDLRAGFDEETVNKAIKGLIPVFPYMRCCLPKDAKLAEWPWEDGVFSQVKADAMFVNLDYTKAGEVRLSSRQGQQLPMDPFAELVKHIGDFLERDCQYHGELMVWKNGNPLARALSNGVINRVKEGGAFEAGEEPRVYLWDKIPLDVVHPKGKCGTTYAWRFENLQGCIQRGTPLLHIIETRVVHSLSDAMKHYREQLAKGLEGTILKHPGAIWRDGDSKQQVKLKLSADCDLRIKGFNPGEGKHAATFGSARCESECGGLEVNVSGFKDDMRLWMHERQAALVDTVMTVKANAVQTPSDSNPKHSLYLPRFVELRKDKSKADTLFRIVEQFEAAAASA